MQQEMPRAGYPSAVINEAQTLRENAQRIMTGLSGNSQQRMAQVQRAQMMMKDADRILGVGQSVMQERAAGDRTAMQEQGLMNRGMMQEQGATLRTAMGIQPPEAPKPFDPTSFGFRWEPGIPGQEGMFVSQAGNAMTRRQMDYANMLASNRPDMTPQDYAELLALIGAGKLPLPPNFGN